MNTRLSRITGVCILSLVLVIPASAATITVGSEVGVMVIDSNDMGVVTPTGPDSFRWQGNMTNAPMGWGLNWDLNIDTDPSVTGVSAFTNMMGVTANFTLNVSANSTIGIAAPTVSGASTISVLDTNGDGATMAALVADAIYDAQIQGNSQQTLFADPFSLVALPNNVNQTGTAWGPQASTVPLAFGDSFGIFHDFSLTAGDQATVNSSFFIVPEPATAMLLIFGAAGVMVRRRR